jgi:hypothetical protein
VLGWRGLWLLGGFGGLAGKVKRWSSTSMGGPSGNSNAWAVSTEKQAYSQVVREIGLFRRQRRYTISRIPKRGKPVDARRVWQHLGT